MRRYGELLLLALGSLWRRPLRVALTSLGVAIAVGALISMVGLALGLEARVAEPFQKMELLNRIDVQPIQSGKEPAPVLDGAAVAKIAALPGVTLAYPDFRMEKIEVHHADRSKSVSAVGMPPEASQLLFVGDAMVAGHFLEPGRDEQIVLGRKLAESLGFGGSGKAVGARLLVKAKGLIPGKGGTFHLEEREVETEVVGVWDPPAGRHGYELDGAVLPLALIQRLPGVDYGSSLERLLKLGSLGFPGYPKVVVRVDKPSDLFLVQDGIKKMGFSAQALLDQFKQMRTGFVILELVLTSVGTVALVVAGLGIINTLLMAVLERYREIGTYKALGASDGDVRFLFLAEAGLVGLLGGIGGLALGRIVSAVIEIVVNRVAQSRGVEGPFVAFLFPTWLLLGAMLFAMLFSLLSGVFPAARAARLDPIRALRSE